MGVPKFYRWISERYPCLSEVVKEHQVPEFDNLYLDMNGIIHVCSHPNDNDPHFRISEEKIFADICYYIDFIFKIIKPKKVFFMAVDGVAPRAKMNQQRGRRFRTAKDAVTLEQKAREHGEVLPTETRFDSNCITPGTVFMDRLHDILKNFVAFKISTDILWQNLRIYLSGHDTPGEGEHKVMDFIRFEKSSASYDPNTRHCLYGLDADLIMLGLCSHEPHFSLLREEVRFGNKSNQKRIATAQETTFHLLHLSLLREYLAHEFLHIKDAIDFDFDIERIIDDFVLMSFLVGNDFIPNLPELHIHRDALPILFKTYSKALPELGGYINEAGHLNLKRFEMFLGKLVEFDYTKFGEHSEFPPPGSSSKNDHSDYESEKLCDKLVGLGFSEQSCNKTTEYDTSSEEDEDGAIFELEFKQHKENYYRDKLQYSLVTPEVLKEQAEVYVTAIQWNLYYYYNGVPSWSWYYPHHYAPYISDIKNFKNMVLKFEMGEPFSPFQQLIAVLPPLSKELLPESYQELMTNNDSPIKDFYPDDFLTDLNGKRQEWEAIVLIPFINESLLVKCSNAADKKLSPEERRRNKHGTHMLFTYSNVSSGRCITFLPKYFPPMDSDHSKCLHLNKNFFRVPVEKLNKGLCPGVLLDVHFPGFPTLKHIKHSAKLSNEKVKVFQMVSQHDNMMITINEPMEDRDLKSVADEFLGKTIYVSWPHLQEALVVCVSDATTYFEYDDSKSEKYSYNSRIWESQVESVETHYYQRLGIFVGDISILVHVRTFAGSKLVCSTDGTMVKEKQYSTTVTNHPLQTVIKNLSVHCPEVESANTFRDLYSINAIVFMLAQPLYGCMGVIIDNDLEKHRGHISVKFQTLKEPDLSTVIKNQKKLSSQQYMPGYILAQNLGISSYFLSRITGTFFIQTNSKESISPNRANVGLNLKFNRTNEEVAGFSKKTEGNQWVYSNQVLDILNAYFEKFPDFFEKLIGFVENDTVYLEDLYPKGDGKEIVSKITEWLKGQQCASAEKQTCGMNILDENVVAAIEAVTGNSENTQAYKTMLVEPKNLYNPLVYKGNIMPQPNAIFQLFDRVINVGRCTPVTLGLRGTVIGIRAAEQPYNYIYEVLFDKEFFGGINLRCNSAKGYRMSSPSLINISIADGVRREPNTSNSKQSQRSKQSYNGKESGARKQDSNESRGSPQKKIQILKKGLESNKPFYKTEKFPSFEKEANSDSSFSNGSPGNIFNNANKEFVTPKASPVSKKASPGGSKAMPNESSSEFEGMWKNLLKGQSKPSNEQSSPKKVPPTKCVAVQELFDAVRRQENIMQNVCPAFPAMPRPEPKKPLATVELMNHCMRSYYRLPSYTYQKLGMTNMYISSVTLPNGATYSSAQFPSKEETSENAAELAMAAFRRTASKPVRQDNAFVEYPVVNNNMFFTPPPPPPFSNPFFNNPNVQYRLPNPIVPPASYVPLLRYPSTAPNMPENYIKLNQFMQGSQLPNPIDINPPRGVPTAVQSSSAQESKLQDLGLPPMKKDSMFVPLQVLKQSTKEQETEKESSNVLAENEWPTLSPSKEDIQKPTVSVSNSNIENTEAKVQEPERKQEKSTSSVSTCAEASKVLKPKKRPKVRLAAAFTHKPELH